MNKNRLSGLMGLCVRARQASFGEEGCRKAIQSGQSTLLLVDGGASANTLKRYQDLCERAGVRMEVLPEGQMASATGRPGMAMAVLKGPLAYGMISVLNQDA